jgi:hypothetical protein
MTLIAEAGHGGDAGNRHAGAQQFHGALDAQLLEVGVRGQPRGFAEYPDQVERAERDEGGELAQGHPVSDLRGQILLDPGDRRMLTGSAERRGREPGVTIDQESKGLVQQGLLLEHGLRCLEGEEQSTERARQLGVHDRRCRKDHIDRRFPRALRRHSPNHCRVGIHHPVSPADGRGQRSAGVHLPRIDRDHRPRRDDVPAPPILGHRGAFFDHAQRIGTVAMRHEAVRVVFGLEQAHGPQFGDLGEEASLAVAQPHDGISLDTMERRCR